MPKHHVMKESRSFRAIMKRTEEEQRRQRSTSPFAGTGVSPNGSQGIDSDNYVAGLSGFSLNGGTGVAEFEDIILRDLPNSMLAEPVVPGVASAYDEGFNVTTTFTERAAQDVTVPAGYTRLLATVTGWIFAFNGNTTGGADGTGTDALWCFVRVGGPSNSDSKSHGQGISGNGGFTTATAGLSVLKTGLTPGGTVRVGVYAGCSFASLGTNAGNTATLSGSLLWLR